MTQVVISFEPQPASNGTATSNAAAVSMIGKTGTLRAKVYALIKGSRMGFTADELEISSLISLNTIRPRLVELREAGLVYDSGFVRKTRSGRDAVVWMAR